MNRVQKRLYCLVSVGIFAIIGCTSSPKEAETKKFSLIRYQFKKNELASLCDQAIASTKLKLDEVGARSPQNKTFDNSLLKLETDLADFDDVVSPLVFMGYVSRDEWLREEASDCEKKVGQFSVEVFTRKDLYNAIKDLKGRTPEEVRLHKEAVKSFERNGLKLDDDKLAQLRDLKQKLSDLETQFSANLNNDKSTVLFTAQELDGVPDSFLQRLQKSPDGRLIVTTKSTDYVQVMQSAKDPSVRKRMMVAYNTRAGEANTKLLKEALVVRQKIATLMGYKTWADYRIEDRMAQTTKTVQSFLNGLKGKLSQRNQADLAQLLKFKKQLDPKAQNVDAWDLTYLAYQLKKRDFDLDEEKIREYFPADFVMKEMFGVYSEILSVKFERVDGADTWAPDVAIYRILDSKTNELIAYFHADFTPREGKYGHAAAFTLRSGRMKDGQYVTPISSIVANFNPPANGKPSLLSHGEVETLFHEFGHIMHQTLTKAPYASMSGSSVKRDFVEAPSQMLENWVWKQPILNRLSGHYSDTSKKLPPELLNRMLAARDFNLGYGYMRQLMFGFFDFQIHTAQGEVDVTKVHDELFEGLFKVKAIEGGRFPATFGHMMGGYDAGYYGYLWSEVYAEDMFTRFAPGKLLDPKIGMQYRVSILEKGNMKEPMEMLREFLGREPNSKAFFKRLGLKN